jgi:hypothetical protein
MGSASLEWHAKVAGGAKRLWAFRLRFSNAQIETIRAGACAGLRPNLTFLYKQNQGAFLIIAFSSEAGGGSREETFQNERLDPGLESLGTRIYPNKVGC